MTAPTNTTNTPIDLLSILYNTTKQSENSIPHLRGETGLWRAVLTQALMDAANQSSKPEAKFDREQAQSWLLHGGADFVRVCDYAGLDATYVRRMAKRALVRQCKWRAEPGKAVRSHKAKPKSKRSSSEAVAHENMILRSSSEAVAHENMILRSSSKAPAYQSPQEPAEPATPRAMILPFIPLPTFFKEEAFA